MAGRIPQSFIDDLLARADIVEIINSRVPLKKKGREYSACCPFHNEKTPSFTVSETKQFYHCFGCGAHGTALGFIMEYENLDFVDAIEALAAEYQLEVPREASGGGSSTPRDDKQHLYELLDEVSTIYQLALKNDPRAVDYLRNRGLTGEVAARYKIGYAPDGWQFITDRYTDPVMKRAVVDTGLVVEKEGKRYDRLRDRITFPIHDQRGRTIGFGGRVLDKGEPKYLNSPENVVFHKGQELYGLYEARKNTRNIQRIIIVEGYMDVVALAQYGISYAVASLGTATTKEQIQKALRTSQELVFCYDGDNAGRKAAWRALENSLPILKDGHIMKFLFLPQGEDPDTLIRKEGKEAFESRMETATPLSDFLFDAIKEEIDTSSVDGRARYADRLTPILRNLQDSVFKDLMYQQLSTIVGISEEKLRRGETTPDPDVRAHKNKRQDRSVKQNATRTAIALMVQYPDLLELIDSIDEFRGSDNEGHRLIYKIHDQIHGRTSVSPAVILESFRGTKDERPLSLLMEMDIPGIAEEADRKKVFLDSLANIRKNMTAESARSRRSELEEKSRQGGLTDTEKQEYLRLISRDRV